MVKLTMTGTDLDDILMPNRQQAIIWISDGLDYKMHYSATS